MLILLFAQLQSYLWRDGGGGAVRRPSCRKDKIFPLPVEVVRDKPDLYRVVLGLPNVLRQARVIGAIVIKLQRHVTRAAVRIDARAWAFHTIGEMMTGATRASLPPWRRSRETSTKALTGAEKNVGAPSFAFASDWVTRWLQPQPADQPREWRGALRCAKVRCSTGCCCCCCCFGAARDAMRRNRHPAPDPKPEP